MIIFLYYSRNKLLTNFCCRKYIENVLKSRGLGNSLSFLHRLHNVVLRKAHITLEKPGSYETDYDNEFFDDEDVPIIEPLLEKEQEEELKRCVLFALS